MECNEYMLQRGRFSVWGAQQVNIAARKIKFVGRAVSKYCSEEDQFFGGMQQVYDAGRKI